MILRIVWEGIPAQAAFLAAEHDSPSVTTRAKPQ